MKKIITIFSSGFFFFLQVVLIKIALGQNTVEKEIFDPNTLNDPEPNWPTLINPLFDKSNIFEEETTIDTALTVIDGYRVQVLATRYSVKADSLRDKLLNYFEDEVYVSFEAPNYKVRVGNCVDRKQAELVQERLKKLGYKSAWIVRTRVWQKPLQEFK